jgi:prepilin-type N-terminal cleavage/methylation domain-containing protein
LNVDEILINHFTKYRKGFSLIEILIVIVIISTITALFQVSFRKIYHKTQLKTASDILKQTLISSRLTAITQNLSIQHKISDNMLCTRIKNNMIWEKWNCKILNGENINYVMKGQINFSSRGFATPKTIKMYLKELTIALIININGSIREEFI